MNNIVTRAIQVTIATLGAFIFAGQVFAGTMSIKLEVPKSPTNITNLKLTFVTLDYSANGNITAKCYKKQPNDAGFSQFGGDIAISAGGNTANCSTDLNDDGTYQFYVTAANAGETIPSDTVSAFIFRQRTGKCL
jgi:hypothetical protein